MNSNLFSNIIELDYNQLESEYNDLPNELPVSFFDKFYNLQIIHIDKKVKDNCELIWFLNNLYSSKKAEESKNFKRIKFKGDYKNVFQSIESILRSEISSKEDIGIYFQGKFN